MKPSAKCPCAQVLMCWRRVGLRLILVGCESSFVGINSLFSIGFDDPSMVG